MKSHNSISQWANTPAARNSANKALFSEQAGKLSPQPEIKAGSEGKRASKYGNRKEQVGEEIFDSVKEASRYKVLTTLRKCGHILFLARQVPFSLNINGSHLADYVADFVYIQDGKLIVEDVKSPATRKIPMYRLKRKAMLLQHGIEIKEI